MKRTGGELVALVLAAGTVLGAAGPGSVPVVPASSAGIPTEGNRCEASLRPGNARIGQPVLYRGRVLVRRGAALRWQPPAGGGAFEWGVPRMRRIPPYTGAGVRTADAWSVDTMEIEVPLQAFTPGMLSVPGLGFDLLEPAGVRRMGRLPLLRLAVTTVLSPDDTSASLRPLRGPLGAPWWERVPWGTVAWVVLALAGVAYAVRRLRRRPAPVAERSRPRPAKDPATVALEALAALRESRLAENGRFAGHALELTRILRRFLEATLGAPRPGDSTPELLVHLGATQLAQAERERVGELLAAWDRVKFARAASSAGEARRAEDAVEGVVRRFPPGTARGRG